MELKQQYHNLIRTKNKLKNLVNHSLDFIGIVTIETNTYCNRKCSFCPNSKYDYSNLENNKLMKLDTFNKIISDLKKINYTGIISLSFYNEPLTDDRIYDLIKHIKDNLSCKVHINTNGDLLTFGNYIRLRDSGLDSILITRYDNDLTNDLKKILFYRKLNDNMKLKIRTNITNELMNRGGEIELKDLPKELPCNNFKGDEITINHKGQVILCCNDYHSSIVLGDINKENLIDIYNKNKALRKELKNKIFKLDICKKCNGL